MIYLIKIWDSRRHHYNTLTPRSKYREGQYIASHQHLESYAKFNDRIPMFNIFFFSNFILLNQLSCYCKQFTCISISCSINHISKIINILPIDACLKDWSCWCWYTIKKTSKLGICAALTASSHTSYTKYFIRTGEHFPYYWPFKRGIHHSLVLTKG